MPRVVVRVVVLSDAHCSVCPCHGLRWCECGFAVVVVAAHLSMGPTGLPRRHWWAGTLRAGVVPMAWPVGGVVGLGWLWVGWVGHSPQGVVSSASIAINLLLAVNPDLVGGFDIFATSREVCSVADRHGAKEPLKMDTATLEPKWLLFLSLSLSLPLSRCAEREASSRSIHGQARRRMRAYPCFLIASASERCLSSRELAGLKTCESL